jgi:tRNA threonylcarbamoyladenosine biosynthesis protein TsaE
VQSKSEDETKAIAERLLLKHWSDLKKNGLIVGLNGSLGVGKTIFAKGVADFLQIKEPITSPTYTYVIEYDFLRHGVAGKFFHFDVWKVDDVAEVERLGLRESVGANRVVVIEWAQKVAGYLQKVVAETGTIFVEVDMSEKKEGRTLEIRN